MILGAFWPVHCLPKVVLLCLFRVLCNIPSLWEGVLAVDGRGSCAYLTNVRIEIVIMALQLCRCDDTVVKSWKPKQVHL